MTTAGAGHDSVFTLLPWYVNGTLTPTERADVDRHLTECAICSREVASLTAVGQALSEESIDVPHPARSLSKAMAAIDTRKGRSWFDAIWNPTPSFARFALAAQLVLIAGLAVAVVGLRSRDQSFTTLSGSGAAAGGLRLSVSFSPDATEETMRNTLREVGGVIVSGPSALGLYIIELTGRSPDDPQVDAEIERLRKNTAVIRFVERQP